MSTESFKVNIPFSKGAEVVLAKERHDFSETAIVESKKTFLGHLISFIPSKLLDTLGINFRQNHNDSLPKNKNFIGKS